jgi:hypothetical protein
MFMNPERAWAHLGQMLKSSRALKSADRALSARTQKWGSSGFLVGEIRDAMSL